MKAPACGHEVKSKDQIVSDAGDPYDGHCLNCFYSIIEQEAEHESDGTSKTKKQKSDGGVSINWGLVIMIIITAAILIQCF